MLSIAFSRVVSSAQLLVNIKDITIAVFKPGLEKNQGQYQHDDKNKRDT